MKKTIILIIALLVSLHTSLAVAGTPTTPFRTVGTITLGGVLQTAVIPELKITVTKPDGTGYLVKDNYGNYAYPSTEQMVINNVLYYRYDIPVYDAVDQSMGAKTGDAAVIHLAVGPNSYNISIPASGTFTIGNQTTTSTTMNLTTTAP